MTRVLIRCVGCGQSLGHVDVSGGWCYTHVCGSTTFSFDGTISYPLSLIMAVEARKKGLQKDIPHIEYYLGWSDYMDDVKREFLTKLKLAGAIYTEECNDKQCVEQRERLKKGLIEELSSDNSFYIKNSDISIASHFHQPLEVVRELRKKYQK